MTRTPATSGDRAALAGGTLATALALALLLLGAGSTWVGLALVAALGLAALAWHRRRAASPADAALHLHRVVLDSTTDMVSVIDENEVYVLVNDAWCRGTGIGREEALGSTPVAALPSLALTERRTAIRTAIEQGRSTVVCQWVDLPGQPRRYLESSYFPFADRASNHPRVVIVTRDRTQEETERLAREAAAAEQRALLDQFPGYIAVLDNENRYAFANERLLSLLGLKADAVIGRTLPEVLGPERAAPLAATVAQARTQQQVNTESHYERGPGREAIDLAVVHVAGPRHADGRQLVYAFGTDITERRQAERALVRALGDAERANRAKSQFLSRMSHELRTPLNAVLGFGQILAQQGLPLAQQRSVDEILRGGRHLLALINDLLDLGRIEAGELDLCLEPVRAAEVIDDSLGLMQPLAEQHRVHIDAPSLDDAALAVHADGRRLRQVMLNLLSNAIKYNRSGGHVRVSVQAVGPEAELSVHDDGPGLSDEEQQRLFRPFERLGARSARVDGTGIGLALSRSLMQAMGGSIGVESRLGEGSRFWVRLPAAAGTVAAAAIAPPTPATAPVQRRRLLYIEDNPVNAMILHAMLEDLYDVQVESDPVVGMAAARARPPDLLLLDIQLPGIDGYGVLARLRADPRLAGLPVVAVTANAMPEDRSRARSAGFDAYLTKPLDLDLLQQTVQRLLEEKRA